MVNHRKCVEALRTQEHHPPIQLNFYKKISNFDGYRLVLFPRLSIQWWTSASTHGWSWLSYHGYLRPPQTTPKFMEVARQENMAIITRALGLKGQIPSSADLHWQRHLRVTLWSGLMQVVERGILTFMREVPHGTAHKILTNWRRTRKLGHPSWTPVI